MLKRSWDDYETASEDDNRPTEASKRAKIDTKLDKLQQIDNILDLPDYTLLLVLELLPAIDLLQISRTCKRLCCLTKRTKFWYRMNGMKYDTQFCNETEANGFLNYLNRQTCEFRIASTGSKSQILVADSLTRLIDVGRNLTVLALENQKLSNVDFRSRMLTRSLRELSLKNTSVKNSIDFFHRINSHLVNLHTLVLDRCNWFVGHSLMAVAKLPKLVNLSLADCLGIEDAFVYISLSLRFGFRTLRRFDLRRVTCLRFFLDSFKGVPGVHEIYIEKAMLRKRNEVFDLISNAPKVTPPPVLNQSRNSAEITFRVEIYDMNAMVLRDVATAHSNSGDIRIESCSEDEDNFSKVDTLSLMMLLKSRRKHERPVIEGSDEPKLFRPGFPLQPNGHVTLVARNFKTVDDEFINAFFKSKLSNVRKIDLSGCAIQNEKRLKMLLESNPYLEFMN